MAETVGQHGLASFTSPTNGDPLDATVVKANDNSIRNAYVSHDSDSGIHVQSSLLASRPVAGVAGRKWVTTDTGSVRMWFDTGSAWEEITAPAANALTLGSYLTGTSYNGSAAVTTNVNANTTSAVSTVVARDAAGEIAAKKVKLDGSTSGVVGVQAAAIAGTWTATLPDSAGTAGQVLSTNGSGVLSWTTSAGASIGISESTTAATYYPVFFSATSGTASSLNTDGSLSWNPSTNTLAATTLTTTTVTVSGDMTVDTSTLKVDSANNRVGIGTASPTATLNVVGATVLSADLTVDTTTLKVDSTNNRVGIGTASPTALLDVIGAASVRSVEFDGTTSGTVTVQPAATAGTWSLTLPTTAGTNGQALVTNGSGVTSWGAPAEPIDVQTFNSSGTWTKPSAGSMALVEMWGAGGGGGNSATIANISGGGGGGYMFRIYALSDLGATVSVTVGAGGTGTAVGTSSAGGNGGNSTFAAANITVYGGAGGAITNATTVALGGRTGIPTAGSSLDLASAVTITSSNVLETGLTDRVFNGGIGATSSQPPNTNNGAALAGSVYGGGGGYGGNGGFGYGISAFAGSGGAAVGFAGTAPAGGGGRGNGVGVTAGGAGAAGRVRVTTW